MDKYSTAEPSKEVTIADWSQKNSTTTPDQYGGPALGEGPMFRRRKGEGLRKYLERVDMETNARIMEALKKGRKMRERRKRLF